MNKFTNSSIAVAIALLSGSAVSAATITASNGGSVIPTPLNVGEDNPTNSEIQAFNEGVGVLLAADLLVDGVTIDAGTRVDSHMIFLNTSGQTEVTATATFSFDQEIIGVMSSQGGSNLFLSDDIVNGPVTYLSGGYGSNRGLEDNDTADFYTVTSMFDIDVGMHVTEPGDWMRVITVSAVPIPAGILLLPMGLFALGAMRRRRNPKTA